MARGEKTLQFAYGLDIIVKDGSGEGGLGGSFRKDVHKVLGRFCAAGGDHRNCYRVGNRGGQGNIEAALCAVAVHGGEQNFSGTQRNTLLRPGDGGETSSVTPAANHHFPTISNTFCIDGDHYSLSAKFARKFGNEAGRFYVPG